MFGIPYRLTYEAAGKKSEFKNKIISYFWEQASTEFMESDDEDSFFASDDWG